MDKCPVCGYSELRATQRESNIMSIYKNEQTGELVCRNSVVPDYTVDGVKFIRQESGVIAGGIRESTMPVIPAEQQKVVSKSTQIPLPPAQTAIKAQV